jgi:hypothetical protein
MIASLICIISMAALLQFCISYCRSVLAASRRVALSEQVREIAGIDAPTVGAEDFYRLRQLVQLCPERGDDRTEISAIGKYYALLKSLRLTRALVPRVAAWAERERQDCSYFIAVVLDRRIAYSRDLLAQQLADAS